VLSKQRHFEEAMEMFDQAAHLAPEDASPLLLRGITLERQGLLADAAEAYSEALRRQPDDRRAQQLLAKVSAQVEQNMLTGE
jgi:Flp pilus assembly protein TadD